MKFQTNPDFPATDPTFGLWPSTAPKQFASAHSCIFSIFFSVFKYISVLFNVFQYFPIFVSIFSGNRANFRLLTFECSEAICIGSNVQLCKTLRRSKESKSLQLSSFITLYSRNRDRHQTIKDSWVHKLLFKSIFSSSKAIWDIVYFLLYCQLGRKKSCLFNFESIA